MERKLYERSYFILDDPFWEEDGEATHKVEYKAYLIYDTIAKVAKKRGVSKQTIADEIGITMNTVNKMDKGIISEKVYRASRNFFLDKYGLNVLGAICRTDEAVVIWVNDRGAIYTNKDVLIFDRSFI